MTDTFKTESPYRKGEMYLSREGELDYLVSRGAMVKRGMEYAVLDEIRYREICEGMAVETKKQGRRSFAIKKQLEGYEEMLQGMKV